MQTPSLNSLQQIMFYNASRILAELNGHEDTVTPVFAYDNARFTFSLFFPVLGDVMN